MFMRRLIPRDMSLISQFASPEFAGLESLTDGKARLGNSRQFVTCDNSVTQNFLASPSNRVRL